MRGGTKALCVTLTLAAGACASESNELKIRPIADPAAKLRGGHDRLADARAMLALGNVGLAIEGFRKAVREKPDSVEAYAGLAASYEAMGRFDVARTNYEAALALAPDNPALLSSFAVMLDRQGLKDQAAAVRAEVAQRASAAAALAAETERPEPVEVGRSVTVVLPPARPAPKAPAPVPPVAPRQAVAKAVLPKPKRAHADVAVAATPLAAPARQLQVAVSEIASPPVPPPAPRAAVTEAVLTKPKRTQSDVAVAAAPLPAHAGLLQVPVGEIASPSPVPPAPEVAPSLTPPREAELRVAVENRPLATDTAWKRLSFGPVAFASPEPEPSLAPELSKPNNAPAAVAVADAPLKRGARLERMSLGEVALVTSESPVWKPQVIAQSRRSTTVRFVPLRSASVRPAIRILNAARHQGLAARTRAVLVDRGWRRLEIGDAPRVRSSSLVLYPASRRVLGRRLAAQFGLRSIVHDGPDVVVLLGRDQAAVRFSRTGG